MFFTATGRPKTVAPCKKGFQALSCPCSSLGDCLGIFWKNGKQIQFCHRLYYDVYVNIHTQ